MANLSIFDIAKAKGAQAAPDGSYSAGEFDRLGLPFFSGCERCEASLGAYNAYPSMTGYIRCRDCIDDLGFPTVEAFDAHEAANG